MARAHFNLFSTQSAVTNMISFDSQPKNDEEMGEFVSHRTLTENYKQSKAYQTKFHKNIDSCKNCFKSRSNIPNNNHCNRTIQKYRSSRSCFFSETQAFQYLEANDSDKTWCSFVEISENDKKLITSHIKAIHDLSPIISGSYLSLKTFYSSLRQHLDALKSLVEDLDMWNPLILKIIEQKLDNKTETEWKKLGDHNYPSLELLVIFLADRCRFFESNQQEHYPVHYEQHNEKKSKTCVQCGKCDNGCYKGSVKSDENNDEKEEKDSKKGDKKDKVNKMVQGSLAQICLIGVQTFIRSLTKKAFKILAKTIFKFFVKAYLKWQVVTPMSIQLV
ncbi:hypothetical protein HHI36_012182 [Cryptolaemus montrouzieri]|uniref:4Fe-4S ferredoxin-type domain-containing protein n=1 Tax=Cryptolaemus montrouzieri TaxID=559131 RepID=A0ABD2NF19_9CUCU